MWSKLFGGGDGLPREKVDAVVRDGNHRVSVAHRLGVEALDAEVVEVRAAVPIGAAISARDFSEGRQHLHPPVQRERRHYRHAR